ncbi:FAD synthase [[Mycoplasma] collis]|uniref:FAD synthase n=1 Tax=[Mycoplasma] collis TaxID=2127 RepID=UPI00068FCD28|nr:hypothetical protein [[Mycoplasma] collis]
MTKIYNYENENHILDKSIFILGAFEFIHKGHYELIKKARNFNKPITFLLFSNPENLPKNNSKAFSDLNSRIQIIANLKIDNILIIEFNKKIQNLNPKVFLNTLIAKGASSFVIGEDFSIGKNYNFQAILNDFPNTTIVKLLNDNYNKKISTRILKEKLENGDFQYLNKYLISNYLIEISISFKKEIFFNENVIDIPNGIYLTFLIINNKKYYSYIIKNKNNIAEIVIFNFDYEIETIERAYLEIIYNYKHFNNEVNFDLNQNDLNKIKKLLFDLS